MDVRLVHNLVERKQNKTLPIGTLCLERERGVGWCGLLRREPSANVVDVGVESVVPARQTDEQERPVME